MSDKSAASPSELFGREFALLSPEDQQLVLALVYRLRGAGAEEIDYPGDVSFMDFDE